MTTAQHARIPIDADAHELRKAIRSQVNEWLRRHGLERSRDLKADLQRWHLHHETAVLRNELDMDRATATSRTLEAWVYRIDAKFDPDVHREWLAPCPAIVRKADGEPRRCNARKVHDEHGDLITAIDLNVTQLIARCRACGTRWEGERGLMQLRYETNLADLEQDAT